MAYNNLQILNFSHNIVSLSNGNTLVITDNIKGNSINIPEPITHILQINSPGPQGPAGPSGSQGPSGSGGGGGSLSGGTDTYIPLWSGSTALTSSYLNQSGNILKSTSASIDAGLKLDFPSGQYTLGDYTDPNYQSRIIVNGGTASGDASIILNSNDTILGKETTFTISSTENIIETTYAGSEIGLKLDFAASQSRIGDYTNAHNGTSITIDYDTQNVSITGSVNITGSLSLNGNTIGRPYKVYTAIYTQNGGANPTPVLINALENTITPGDTPVITYNNAGVYTITFSSAVLTIGKVFATCNTWGDDAASPIASSAWPQGDAQSVFIGNQFGYDASYYISVEIRVYN